MKQKSKKFFFKVASADLNFISSRSGSYVLPSREPLEVVILLAAVFYCLIF